MGVQAEFVIGTEQTSVLGGQAEFVIESDFKPQTKYFLILKFRLVTAAFNVPCNTLDPLLEV